MELLKMDLHVVWVLQRMVSEGQLFVAKTIIIDKYLGSLLTYLLEISSSVAHLLI